MSNPVRRQLTLTDLQRKPRQEAAMDALGAWLRYPAGFAQPEAIWSEWITRLRIQDGVSILELGPGKSSLCLSLGGGAYYTQVTEDRELGQLTQLIYQDGQFQTLRTSSLTQGEPTRCIGLAVVHLDDTPAAHGPCFEYVGVGCQRGDVHVQVATKSLVDHGYLMVFGEPLPGLQKWVLQHLDYVCAREGFHLFQKPTGRPKRHQPSEDPVLTPAPVVGEDPRPWAIHPWEIVSAPTRPRVVESDRLIRQKRRLVPAFAGHTGITRWVLQTLANNPESHWLRLLKATLDKLELVTYLELRRKGMSPSEIVGVELIEDPAARVYLNKLDRQLIRQVTAYPRNLDPARTFWSLGAGDEVDHPDGRFVVKQVETYLDQPPKVTLEMKEI